ncbi:MAG: hypothetical protein V2A65_01350 [Candidatus Omnitrophota bacterium]
MGYLTKEERDLRLVRVRKVMEEKNLDFNENLILYSDFHIEGGYAVTRKALEEKLEFDALFSNDRKDGPPLFDHDIGGPGEDGQISGKTSFKANRG